jgi:hypothetical protein
LFALDLHTRPHFTYCQSQLLNQLSDHTEIRTWSVFYGTKQQYTISFISNSADGLVYPSTLSGEVLCDILRLVWCVCVRPSLCPPPMVSRYNLRTDFKLCTVVWYHKIQIKFEFQCDQIIGSKVVTENMWNVAGYEDPRQTIFNMLHWGWTFN